MTVRAAIKGIIDFSRARLYDPAWWKYCYVIFNGIREEENREILQTIHQHYLALVANSGLDNESFRRIQDTAYSLCQTLLQTYQPWEQSDKGKDLGQENIKQLKAAYKQTFGFDISDQQEEQRRLKAWLDTQPTVENIEVILQRIAEKRQQNEEARKRR